MIKIKPSPTADTRTCDVRKVSEDTLYESSVQHINDVRKGLKLFQELLYSAGNLHDYDKLTNIEHFYFDFKNDFKTTGWWDNHRKVNRHHLAQEDGVPEDVNLLDVLEFITDCVMAGKARNPDNFYAPEIDMKVLDKAFKNTIQLLLDNVEVGKDDQCS